jgi:hypothetical protein
MGHSGDIEILEKQVALLRDLLTSLDHRRRERRERSRLAAERVTPGPPPAPAKEGRGLRLVTKAPEPAGSGRTGAVRDPRRPRFREKRSWNLAAPPETEGTGGTPAPAAQPPRTSRRQGDADAVPWRAFEHLLRERDDLIIQLMRQQTAEQRLLEARAASEERAEEVRKLREALRKHEEGRFDGLLRRLYQRLAEVEELQKLLSRQVLKTVDGHAGLGAETPRGPGSGAGKMEPKVDAAPGKKFWIRGHEVIVSTSSVAGSYYSFALLTVDQEGGQGMKGFKARAETLREAELQCIDRVLTYLEQPAAPAPRASSSRNLARIRGREVDIFCDLVGREHYQAFPFLYDERGQRQILLRFHLDEAVTAGNAEEARLLCVRRLEAYFDALDAGAAE